MVWKARKNVLFMISNDAEDLVVYVVMVFEMKQDNLSLKYDY